MDLEICNQGQRWDGLALKQSDRYTKYIEQCLEVVGSGWVGDVIASATTIT